VQLNEDGCDRQHKTMLDGDKTCHCRVHGSYKTWTKSSWSRSKVWKGTKPRYLGDLVMLFLLFFCVSCEFC